MTKIRIISKILIAFIVSNICYINVKANIMLNIEDKQLEIYKVKEIDEITKNNILEFYESNINKIIFENKDLDEPVIEQKDFTLNNNVIEFSKKFIGNPYKRGGTSLINGADCSGFVQSIFLNFGITIPRTSILQSQIGEEIKLENIEPASIVSYGYNGKVSHSAIYIGDGKIIHSSNELLGIRIDNINIMPIITIRKII